MTAAVPTNRTRTVVVAGLILVIVATAFTVALVVRRSLREDGYTPEVHETFMTACTRDGGEPVRPVCQCIWDRAVSDVPYERFKQVNAELVAQEAEQGAGVPLHIPDDFGVIVQGCVEQVAPDPATSR